MDITSCGGEIQFVPENVSFLRKRMPPMDKGIWISGLPCSISLRTSVELQIDSGRYGILLCDKSRDLSLIQLPTCRVHKPT
jgi:hypothetical protein